MEAQRSQGSLRKGKPIEVSINRAIKVLLKKHWKHWVWLLWAKPHERLYNALQAYKVEGLVHPNNKEKKNPKQTIAATPINDTNNI